MRAHSVVVLNQRRWQSLDGEHGKGVDGLLCMCIIVFAFTVLTKSIWRVKRQFQQSPKFFVDLLAVHTGTAEYCVPIWSCSAHTSQVDVQLNSTMRLISGNLRSTPLPWLPVLSNIELSAIWRKAATDKLVEKIVKHDSWPIQPDILNLPLLQLTSKKLLDLQPVDIKSRWRHNWKSAQVVNSHLVCDPTIQQPGFDLPLQQWSLLHRFRTKQGHCIACPCGETQMMFHIVESCPLTKLNGYTLRMKTLFCGWQVMVHDMRMRRRDCRCSAVVSTVLFCNKYNYVAMSLQELCNSSIADVQMSLIKVPAVQDFFLCCSFIAVLHTALETQWQQQVNV